MVAPVDPKILKIFLLIGDDDDDEEPTIEQCKKYIKDCQRQDKGKIDNSAESAKKF